MSIKLIEGKEYTDERGKIRYFNELDFTPIRRMYAISPAIGKFRAWQAHKHESKWLYCSRGFVDVYLVKIDQWKNPSKNIEPLHFSLSEFDPKFMLVSGGYANGFIASEKGSELVVYSSFSLPESESDDYRFEPNYWSINKTSNK